MPHIPLTRILLAILLVSLILVPGRASAQTSIEVSRNEVQIDFPTGLHFYISASSQADIQTVTLHYGTDRQTCQPGQALTELQFNPAKQVDLDWELEFVLSGIIPPGVELWWQWEITDASMQKWITDRQTVRINDQRQKWQSLTEGLVTVQWYEGDQAYGSRLVQTAVSALDRMQQEQGLAYSNPIWITIYPSYEALQEAMVTSNEWTGGVAYSDYNAILLGVPLEQADFANSALPHELNHLVVNRLTFNCVGARLPTWLVEGLAMFSEGPLPDASRQGVLDALGAGTLPTLQSLAAGFSAYSDQANLSYNQSEMVVDYLVKTYGPQGLRNLLDTITTGKTIDEALTQVYTLDTDGLDGAWRKSLGFTFTPPERAVAQAESTTTPVPTLALWTPAIHASATLTETLPVTPTLTATLAGTPTKTASPTIRPSPTITPTPVPTPRGAPWLWGGLAALLVVVGVTIVLAVIDVAIFRRSRRPG